MNTKSNPLHDLKGERKNQILVVVDRMGKPVGLANRETCHTGNGKPHLAFMAFIFDTAGNIILTRRSGSKSLWSGYWDASVVSHVLPGETPETAAQRRGKEEMGVDIKFSDAGAFYYFEKYGNGAENEYCHVL
ncbi:MAG: NUDIX domain-containing protein, partial [Nitrososphaerota archaeon]|nr:NUDIX domain-containing protein [Nitrososphaerota archaeon]